MPKVTVYITAHNCEAYIDQAIQSVLSQIYQDFELIIINDRSSDGTAIRIDAYEHEPRIRIIHHTKNKGLIASAKEALRHAKGEYIMRLDGDDWLDEHALLIMASVLDRHPEVGLVYPDYFITDERGRVLQHIRQKKIGTEVKLLDLPAHGACTMVRRRCYKGIGGYSRGIHCQDGYDLWIKFIQKYTPYNINLPLFYYRQHGTNLTKNTKRILSTRKLIKEKFFRRYLKKRAPRVLAIIPARGTSHVFPRLPLKQIAGKPLLAYAISALQQARIATHSVFVSEDAELRTAAKRRGIEALALPETLATEQSGIEPVVQFALDWYKTHRHFSPQIVVLLYLTSPLITPEHIREAVQTLLIFKADSVVSVKENKAFLYRHGTFGLEPLFEKRELKFERDLLFEETGSLMVTKASCVSSKRLLGKKVSHVVLSEDEAIDINTPFQFWLAEQLLKRNPL